MKTINSKITAVTVYTDRAQVTRCGNIKLEKGEQQLCFDNLPDSIEQKSIRISGTGDAILRDINFKTVNFSQPQTDAVKTLNKERKKINEKLEEQNTIIKLADLERDFLTQITDKITSPEKSKDTGELNPDRWIQMIEFYRSKLEDLEKQKAAALKTTEELSNQLKKLENDLYQLNAGSDQTRNQVEVTVELKSAGDMELELSYIVYGPLWYPVYDLRVSTDSKQMNITYNAMVSQASSEDWSDVQLKLSTAQVQVDGTIPELTAWHLNMTPPSLAYGGIASRSASSLMKKEKAYDDEILAEEPMMMDSSLEMVPQEALVETQAASVVFVPSGTNTVLCDNNPYRITVLIQDFPAEFNYGTVPKLSPYTYLKAKVKNESEYPMLCGECNVFLDNNFVSSTHLDTVAPSQEFWTSLGVDESIKVERKFIRKFEKKEGLISKKTKFIYEYRFVIENKRKTEERLMLHDQIPISGHQDLIIELIQPKYDKNTDNFKINEEKLLEWNLIIRAGSKIEIPFSFSVEYPRSEMVYGLE